MVGELLGQQVKGRLSLLTSIAIIEYLGILSTLSEQDLVDAPATGLTMTPLFSAFIVEAEQTSVVAVSRPDLIQYTFTVENWQSIAEEAGINVSKYL